MKVADSLKGVQRLYIETAPLIYYVEEHPTYIAKMDVVVTTVENTSIEAVSSVITLTEVLNQPIKCGVVTGLHRPGSTIPPDVRKRYA